MLDLKNLETFAWVAELGSFRATAERLNTTQPAISARIAQLEADIGVKLLERDRHRVIVTRKGGELLAYAQRMLALRSEMLVALADKKSFRGQLRLGVSETIVHTWLSTLIERLHALFPRIVVEIEVDTSMNLRDALVERNLDIGFLLGPISDPRIKNLPLCRYPLAWIASPDLPLPKQPVPLAELAHWPIITYSRRTRPHMLVREMFSGPDMPRVQLYGNSSLATIVRMTLDRIGVSVIPPVVVPRELASGSLRVVRAERELPPLDFTVCYPAIPHDHVVAAVAELAVEVAARFRPARERKGSKIFITKNKKRKFA